MGPDRPREGPLRGIHSSHLPTVLHREEEARVTDGDSGPFWTEGPNVGNGKLEVLGRH